MKKHRVAILIDRQLGYCHGVLRGIWRYLQRVEHWEVRGGDMRPNDARAMLSYQPDAVLGGFWDVEVAALVAELNIPVVDVYDWVEQPRFHHVGTDNHAIGALAGEHLIGNGFRNLAYLGGTFLRFHQERWEGLHKVAAVAGLHIARSPDDCVPLSVWGFVNMPTILQRLEAWLGALPRPCGLCAASDDLGYTVLQLCAQTGIHVPEDLAVIGVDDNEFLCQLARPALSSLDINTVQVGYQAAETLDRILQGEAVPPRRLVPPSHVVVRQSSDILAVTDPMVAQALVFIRSHARHPIGVDDVLRQTGLPRRTLERRFQRAVGRGILAEILRCRIERAKHLLDTTDLNLPDIAARSGFGSAQRLTKCFTGRVGLAPSIYRKRLLGGWGV